MSLRQLHEAAKLVLDRLGPGVAGIRGDIDRLTIDVVHAGEREMVSFRVRGADLTWSCTCGAVDCDHAVIGMRLLAAEPLPGGSSIPPRRSEPPDGRASTTDTRGLALTDRPLPADHMALTEALQDVITAVVRTGVAATGAPSVFESLERLAAAAPEPLPLGVSRWIGRMRLALNDHNVDLVARMLDGAARLVDDLRHGACDDDGRARVTCWLGADANNRESVVALSDRVMIELGRELLDGATRAGIERRHLLDIASGRLYREERMRGSLVSSLGTCPRIVHVGLAEVERGTGPERIRLLQYASSPHVPAFRWQEARSWATPNFAGLATHYATALAKFPGVAEPVALVSTQGLTRRGDWKVADDEGRELPLFGGAPGNLDALEQRLEGDGKPGLLYGRLVDRGDVIHLRPISFGLLHESDRFELVRL